MSDTPTFRLGDSVWIAEVESVKEMPCVLHKEAFILLHGIVKKVKGDGNIITVWWIDPTYGVLECIVIAISRGYIQVNTARYKSNIPLRPKDLFETEEEALLAALDGLDTDIVLETNSIKQHNENIVELTAKKEGLMKAYQARHQL